MSVTSTISVCTIISCIWIPCFRFLSFAFGSLNQCTAHLHMQMRVNCKPCQAIRRIRQSAIFFSWTRRFCKSGSRDSALTWLRKTCCSQMRPFWQQHNSFSDRGLLKQAEYLAAAVSKPTQPTMWINKMNKIIYDTVLGIWSVKCFRPASANAAQTVCQTTTLF